MKWAFLLRKESPSAGGSAFYGFIPYDFGPFSFCLQRDLGKMVEDGIVAAPDSHHWSLPANAQLPSVEPEVCRDVRQLIARFGSAHDADTVVDYVYEHFPAYTVNSRRRNRPKVCRPVAQPAVYTAGYEGLSADEFLDVLVQSGIECLADVRRNPVARRYGFHKSSLSKLCDRLGIEYIHIPELGIASELRQDLQTQADRDQLFDRYEATTLSSEPELICYLAELVLGKPTVLVCMEALACECHRSRLAAKVAAQSGLAVRHLRGPSV